MPLAQELPDFRYVPRGVDAEGRVTLNERCFSASFLVSAEVLVEHWRPRRVAELVPEDLEPAFALAPAVLLLGTGTRHAFPAPAVLAAALTRGIGLEAMDNAAAARTFAVLAGEGRRVVAAFLIDAG
ncbi:Mth938-like domain-containing protein [Silanimonas lenta]|uniref:Mth938-like domain-containing protein n=1 Tax=Silanimonas lenta TaxID=265429 RepID=UPI000406DE4F|nr:MTH938/NDUFAF3 family protein [Silanimonas lenta]